MCREETREAIFGSCQMRLLQGVSEHIFESTLATYDPYDLWKSELGVLLKKLYYRYGVIVFPIIAPLVLSDLYAPKLIRNRIKKSEFPIVRALAVLCALNLYECTGDRKYIGYAKSSAKWLIHHRIPGFEGSCWGHNMQWMSKNGYYSPSTPFITITPYCVEALLKYYDVTADEEAFKFGISSVHYLEKNLKVCLDEVDKLALSYGPCQERRIVINANSYAMMMYSMLAGRLPMQKDILLGQAQRIFNFIKSRQKSDGSWLYYDDNEKGNFVDCLHSCFILKNLLKYKHYSGVKVSDIVDRGLEYILKKLMDYNFLLVKKFSIQSYPSVVKFDLYDQAELLNVLLMTDKLDLAKLLIDSIMKYFHLSSNNSFGCQIDIFGRLNKMTYLRWGVMPLLYVLSECHTYVKDCDDFFSKSII